MTQLGDGIGPGAGMGKKREMMAPSPDGDARRGFITVCGP